MKKSTRTYLTMLVVVLLIVALALSACDAALPNNDNANAGTQTDNGATPADTQTTSGESADATQTKTVVTYVSTDSTVLSSTAEVVKQVADPVVEISTETATTQWGRQYIVSGAGSGVIVGKENNAYYIITNHHVISGANEITVRTRAGQSYAGQLLASDDSADLAVVTIQSDAELAIATMGDSDDLQIGEDLIAIGNPLGNLGGTVTKGILSATQRSIQINDYEMTLLQTDTAINPGNSGGGLFNMAGHLIGVVNAKTSDEEIEGICFAIPINIAKKVYADLVQYGYIVGRATFNLAVAEATISSTALGSYRNIVYVTALGEDAADNFALYDRISKINGVEITSILDLNIALAQVEAGDTVTVEVYRGEVVQSRWSSSISFASEPTTFTTTALQYGK